MKKLLLALLSLAFVSPALAEEVVHATLITQQATLIPGLPIHVGVLLEPQAGWHTYWENPGDAGMATELAWTLPPGFMAGAIEWPAPKRIAEGPLVTFSYDGPVLLPVTVIPPQHLTASSYTIGVKAQWLACKEICVPESAVLALSIPVGTSFDLSPQAGLFAQPRPKMLEGDYYAEGKNITLSLPIEAGDVTFMPRQPNIIHYAAPQTVAHESGKTLVTLEADKQAHGELRGFLIADNTTYKVTLAPQPVSAGGPPGVFLPALLLALLGGIILNLMPCVLPVLSLKALAIAKKAGHERRHTARLGIAYTVGILLSFALVAGLLISLRASGEAVGWGFQMQSPAFVGFLAWLLFMVGLNLSGLFDLPVLLGNVGGEMVHESTARGSFFTGILATAVATPCTAPFMAPAIGAALTLPPLPALLIFEALGLGLALPFLLISIFPGMLRFLPKPGPWMVRLRQILALPIYASVLWLLWVLGMQTGSTGTVIAIAAMLAALIAVRMKRRALLLCLLVLAVTLPMLAHMERAVPAMPASEMQGVTVQDYSPQALAYLRAAGKPVLVDATAAWCITCQVNSRIAINTPRTLATLKNRGITLMIADWTRRNDAITDFLSGFGYKGVPLAVFYPAHGEPVVLPQILTEDRVIEAISK